MKTRPKAITKYKAYLQWKDAGRKYLRRSWRKLIQEDKYQGLNSRDRRESFYKYLSIVP